jgi:stage II sporulation protein M
MRVTDIVRQKAVSRNLILATAVFCASLVVGTLIGQNTVEGLLSELGAVLGPLASMGNLSLLLLLVIFVNNAIKALGIIFLGILLGLPPVLFIGLNGFILGGLGSAIEATNGWRHALVSFAPHGVIEIPVILLATALSLTVGMESARWLVRRESRVKSRLSDGLKVYVRWILPGLAIAAVIEVFVTPLLVRLASNG